MSGTPNIFAFATKELSQDAFICWLVSWVNCDENPAMQRCGREFVALLYNTFQKTFKAADEISADQVTNVENLRQQYLHIDVYFQSLIAGRRVSFVIEDKTHTTHHSGQLQRYKKRVQDDEEHEDETVLIYFKMGFLHTWDKLAADEGYAIVDYELFQEFLDAHETNDYLFESYKGFARETYYLPYKERFPRLLRGEDTALFGHWHVQWQFMQELQSRLADLGESAAVDCSITDTGSLYSGSNRGGSWWTELRFVTVPRVYGEVEESVFYRVDWRKDAYYLAIRQYAGIEKGGEHAPAKLERLATYRSAFDSVKDAQGEEPLAFGKPSTDNVGNKESEIAVVFFDSGTNSPQRVLDKITPMHAAFVGSIRQSGLVPPSTPET